MTIRLSSPDPANFKEKYSLPITANGKKFDWNTYMFPHAFIQVEEETKHEILKNLFTHASQHNRRWEINYIRSSERDILRYASFKKHINKSEVGVEKGVEILDYIIQEKNRRYQIMANESSNNYLDTKEVLKTNLLIIDKPEKFLFLTRSEEDFETFKLINRILRLGRAAGMHIVFLSEEHMPSYLMANITYSLTQDSFPSHSSIFLKRA